MRVLLIRHGQTDWNKLHRIQGTHDIPLNEEGIKQAEKARESIDKEHIDVCYCSPLTRTRQTADVLIGGRDIPIFYDERIVEKCFGEIEGKSMSDFNFDESWVPNRPRMYEGMETFEELMERITSFYDELYEKYPDKTVLIVTHGGTSIASGYYFCGPPKNDRSEYFCKNCVIKEYNK